MTKARHHRSTFVTRSLATVAALAVTTALVSAGVRAASASIVTEHAAAASLEVTGSLDATGILAGGEVERVVSIHVPAGVHPRLAVTAETSSVLDQDARNGLQLRADLCSGTWRRTEAGYACAGTVTALFASRPVVGSSALTLTGGSAAVHQVRLTLSLPGTADGRFMGQTSALSYRIAA
jgi:hypothetical protein